jgi:hypothetical protein
MKDLSEIQELVDHLDNDHELGMRVRYYIVKINKDTNNFIKCIHCGTYQPAISHKCKYCKDEVQNQD